MNREKICELALISLTQGKTQALADIYDAAARNIFSLAYTITGNYCDAEDVLQNTMIDITRSCWKFTEGKAMAWILTIARHNALDLVRKRAESTVIPMEYVSESDIMTDERDFSLVDVRYILSSLDDDEKQIVVMRLYSKMPYSEIAEVMGIKLFAAQKKYQRAIAKLKKYNT